MRNQGPIVLELFFEGTKHNSDSVPRPVEVYKVLWRQVLDHQPACNFLLMARTRSSGATDWNDALGVRLGDASRLS